ncbi:hypothetical protein DYBT9275_01839 [Dyadobacter sp. CECT 9275]|uniref:Uncharacterized protein n=1 Tax=Dyadobacter helix TaxID=2822344 RepID=A0A916JAS4_9BACT|nr:hypothetical protein [Dyadobacter sp. CECT 9275]CAG4997729.1 hypothetical protein DYBT9275_01839 [Dyadobacter sp. CECT 9275]
MIFILKNYAVNEGILDTTYITNGREGLKYRKTRNGVLVCWQDQLVYLGGYTRAVQNADLALISRELDVKYLRASGKTVLVPSGEIKSYQVKKLLSVFEDRQMPFHDLSKGGLAF